MTVFYKTRKYLAADFALKVPEIGSKALEQLGLSFGNVAAFGGMVRTPLLNEIHKTGFTYSDIDLRVADPLNAPRTVAKKIFEFKSEKDVLWTPDRELKETFKKWNGLNLHSVRSRPQGINMISTLDDAPHQLLDISWKRAANPDLKGLPFALTPLAEAPAPFTSAAIGNDGVLWLHEHTVEDMRDMDFDIFRDLGLRTGSWAIGYYNRLHAEKYPALKLTNLRLPLVKAIRDLRNQALDCLNLNKASPA